MSTAEQIIAHHREHSMWFTRQAVPMVRCYCKAEMRSDQFAAHVVAALTNAGKTIVDLPEADEGGGWTWTPIGRKLWGGADGRTILVEGLNALGPVHLSHEYAGRLRDCLSAALAAARVAEGGERRG